MFLLSYEAEVIVSIEVELLSIQVQTYDNKSKHEALSNAITFLEEKRNIVVIQATTYQQRITCTYNWKV